MTRKNKKRIKKFGINLKIKPEAFNDVSQLNFLLEDTRNVLLAEIRSKGYKPVNKQKMIPYSHINNIAESDEYQVYIEAVYVGKKKALEE